MFTQLSHLLGAHISLAESIALLQTYTIRTSISDILPHIEQDIQKGQTLSQSVQKYPHLFNALIPAYLYIGEQSGSLPRMTELLAQELRKKQLLRKKILGSLLYPCIITLATLGITGILILVIFPKLIPLFYSLHIPLPLSTRSILFISTFIQTQWLMVFLFFVACLMMLHILYHSYSLVRSAFEYIRLHTPIIGFLFRTYYLVLLYRTIGTLLQSNVPILEALSITKRTLPSATYRNACATLFASIHDGKTLSAGMSAFPDLFSRGDIASIAVAEQTGNLPHTFLYLSALQETDLEEATRTLTTTIEPILMIIMGLLVGFIALSIVTPMYELTQHLNIR